jgi:hypothetical protein
VRKTLVAVALAALVATAGCSAFGGGDGDAPGDDTVEVANPSTNETAAYAVSAPVGDDAAGSEWDSLSVEYPREHFTVSAAQHDELELGVDTDDDGEVDRELNETHVSGVNNNDYSFTVELDTDYALESGDELHVTYPNVENPDEAGNYTAAVTVNDAATTNATVGIGE